MNYNNIRNFFGQQNFAQVSTNADNIEIFVNTADRDRIFCVLIDNRGALTLNINHILQIKSRLESGMETGGILFLVVTDNVERDKELASASGETLWLVDSINERLLIFEDQPDDFYGLRTGIERSVVENEESVFSPKGIQKAIKRNNFPWVSIIIIAVNVIWYIVIAALGNPEDANHMQEMGAAYGPYVFEKYQFWRLITSMFMHFGISHLMGNMIYLALFGTTVEKAIGHWRFLAIYMLSGFAASLISCGYYYLSGFYVVSAGASGAVYGLIAAVAYLTFKNRGRMGSKEMWIRIGIVLIFIFYSNFINSEVDAVAHLAGFGFGLLLSATFIGGRKNEKS